MGQSSIIMGIASTDTFGMSTLTDELNVDEGCKAFPYTDTRGCLSIARGRNLTGRGVSPDEIEYLFANDVASCCRDLDSHAPWWRALSPSKQRVMLGLVFNLGWQKFSEFHRFLAAMEAGNWPEAALELQDSLWWGQVGLRGPRVVARLLATEVVS
jgi:lysozyme